MNNIKNSGKIIATILFGILYLSCKTDKKTTTTVSNSKDVLAKEEVERSEPSYNHFDTNGLSWSPVENMANIAEAGSKMYLIDIYTEWCGWCKMMDRKTFSDPAVQEKLKENFNLFKLDGESKSDLTFGGELYKWRGEGEKGIHELAAKLMKGQIEYPALIFLDENLKTVRVSKGYKNPADFIQELDMALRS